MVLSTTDWTSAAFETSQRAPSTVNPCERILATVGVSHSSRRAHSIRDAPASASPSAISCPMPRDPPVTIAMRPSSLNNSLMVGTLSGLYFPAARLSTERTHDTGTGTGKQKRRTVPDDGCEGRRGFRPRGPERRAAAVRTDGQRVHAEGSAPGRREALSPRLGAHPPAAEEGERPRS